MTDTVDTTDAPLPMQPARFFFEIGFFAAHAEALVKNGTPPFAMSDALVDHAWDIARDASDDPREFDRYLSRADSADQRLAEGEATYHAFDAANRCADGSREGLAVCAKSLRIYGADLFPATREGQVHFARVLMDAVATTIEAALIHRPEQGRPITEACGIAMVEVLPVDRDELERGLITQGFPPERAKELAQGQPANDGALQMLARHRLAALASAPAGDGVEEGEPAPWAVAAERAASDAYAQHMGLPEESDPTAGQRAAAIAIERHAAAALARPRAAVGEQSREAPNTITYNPVYRVTYEGSDPSRGYVYALQSPPAKVEGQA